MAGFFNWLMSCFTGDNRTTSTIRNKNDKTAEERKKEGDFIKSSTRQADAQENEQETKSEKKHGAVELKVEENLPELTVGFIYEGEWIEMSEPIRCTYQQYIKGGGEYEMKNLGEELPAVNDITQNRSSSCVYRSMPVELRGITLRQLRAVFALVERMCEEGSMMSSLPGKPPSPIKDPNLVTLYDINANIIVPFTKPVKQSFVEALPSTAGTQPPRWFMSHFWGEQFVHTLACVETLYKDFSENFQDDSFERGGGMTLDTPIWVCAFANNQHDLSDITEDPAESGFARALEIANYRTISILDVEGIVFTRIWCIEELYLTHLFSQEQRLKYGSKAQGLWAVYTAYNHEVDGEEKQAVGIVAGGTTSDGGDGNYIAERENPFPMERILQSKTINIQTAQASVESDRRHILNSIAKVSNLNAQPFEEHKNYDELNNAVRGAFACSIPALRHSYKEGENEFTDMLQFMEKSINRDPMRFNFENEDDWYELDTKNAIELIKHLPVNIEGLEILYAPFGASFYDAVSEFIAERSQNLKYLEIWHSTCSCGEEQLKKTSDGLARAIQQCKGIERLELYQTELIGSLSFDSWYDALNQHKSLKRIWISGLNNYALEDVDEDTLDEEDHTVENPDDYRMRILWKNGTFPNAVMSEKEIKKLKSATKADIQIDQM